MTRVKKSIVWYQMALKRRALAAAASGGDVKQAPAESPQSGPKGNAQKEVPNE